MNIGVIGGGQLGRMMGLAGIPLGLRFRFLDPNPDAPAGAVGELITGGLDDAQSLRKLAAGADRITFEIENIAVAPLAALTPAPLPDIEALAAGQDRRREKALFTALEIPCADYAVIEATEHLAAAAQQIGFPAVLKANRLGYDGRGQRFVETEDQLASAWESLATDTALLETRIDFDRELSMIAARGSDGQQCFYPLTENIHHDGILRLCRAPFRSEHLQRLARRHLAAILAELDYVGVLTVEFFQQGKTLLANEMAPRVHNSGHWTIEGAATSQFENHLRAICGLPLGSTDCLGHAAMVNLLGAVPDPATLLRHPGLHLHSYDKGPRPKRKVGHCTLIDENMERLEERLGELSAHVEIVP